MRRRRRDYFEFKPRLIIGGTLRTCITVCCHDAASHAAPLSHIENKKSNFPGLFLGDKHIGRDADTLRAPRRLKELEFTTRRFIDTSYGARREPFMAKAHHYSLLSNFMRRLY